MCLLLDHGLRAGEVAALQVSEFNLSTGHLRFYRPMVSKVQIHRLSPDTLTAARTYLSHDDAPPDGPLLRATLRSGQLDSLQGSGLTVRSISRRVSLLGEQIGIAGLSPNDCRHYWATRAARAGISLDRLRIAGGWSSPEVPLRYIEAARSANNGVGLG
jgi:integrase